MYLCKVSGGQQLLYCYHAWVSLWAADFRNLWDNIDFKQRTLTVEKALNYDKRNKKWYYSNPKTRTSSRTILLGSTILNAICKCYIRHNENKLRYGEYFVKQYVLTETVNGRKFDYTTEHDNTVISKGTVREAVCTKENGSMHTKDTFTFLQLLPML